MRRVLFVRHGATAGNLEKRYIGSTDEPLCYEGIEQVKKLRQFHWAADALFVSPMLRTRQTAQLLFPQCPKQIIDDLRETDFGLFEGKTADELSGSREYQGWLDSMCLGPIPNGELAADFKARCCAAFFNSVQSLPDDATAAFVVHGGVIMAILEAYAQPCRSFYEYHIGNGECLWCNYQDGKLYVEIAATKRTSFL